MKYYEIEKDEGNALSSRILQNAVAIDEATGKIIVDKIEIPVTYACNLQCKHCAVHAPYLHGHVADLPTSLQVWSEKLLPKMILVLGGEPLLHPDLPQILETIRKLYPSSDILLITNGLLLPDAPPLFWDVVIKTGTKITISAHLENYKTMCEKIDAKLENDRIQCVEIYCENFYDSWATLWKYDNNNFPVLEANDSTPIFRECLSKNCFTLHGDYLYRCNLMYGLKMLQEQCRWHSKVKAMEAIDGIAHWNTPEQIAEYFTSEDCLYSACAYCTPNHQLKVERCQQLY